MEELPNNSIHLMVLMVTSPPYNVGKEYGENLSLEQYLGFLKGCGEKFIECLHREVESALTLRTWEGNHIFLPIPL